MSSTDGPLHQFCRMNSDFGFTKNNYDHLGYSAMGALLIVKSRCLNVHSGICSTCILDNFAK